MKISPCVWGILGDVVKKFSSRELLCHTQAKPSLISSTVAMQFVIELCWFEFAKIAKTLQNCT